MINNIIPYITTFISKSTIIVTTLLIIIITTSCVREEPNKIPSANITTTEDHFTESTSQFTIDSEICSDEQGPDCSKLRLGDNYLTTTNPSKGYLYSCTDKNPTAPGSLESEITWINFVSETWNFLEKLWLPQGDFTTEEGIYTETQDDDNRQISVNSLPVDGKIGDGR